MEIVVQLFLFAALTVAGLVFGLALYVVAYAFAQLVRAGVPEDAPVAHAMSHPAALMETGEKYARRPATFDNLGRKIPEGQQLEQLDRREREVEREFRLSRDYCAACGYTDSHEANCPLTPAEPTAKASTIVQDARSVGRRPSPTVKPCAACLRVRGAFKRLFTP